MKKEAAPTPRPAPNPLRAFAISLVFSAIAFALLLIGDRGTDAWKKAQDDSRALKAQVAELEAGNAAIAARIENAEHNSFELEKDARERMGLVKPDEIVFLLPAPAAPKPHRPTPPLNGEGERSK
ncbi:MAG TPA: septum formation initiator family protein [Thermoanaerobaculia bacterium]|jgi:cell division protein FtsB|nr:septum formation initiator family protein [Thermoanaerobaculia bacterium]